MSPMRATCPNQQNSTISLHMPPAVIQLDCTQRITVGEVDYTTRRSMEVCWWLLTLI